MSASATANTSASDEFGSSSNGTCSAQPHLAVRIVRGDASSSFFDTRQARVAAAASGRGVPRWSTYSAGQEDPLWYMMLVIEQRDKLRADAQEQRCAEALPLNEPSDPHSSLAELSTFPSLSIHPPPAPDSLVVTGDEPKLRVNAAELFELLRTMFDGVDDALIASVVASLDCLSVDLHQLNECVSTLVAITADDQTAAADPQPPLSRPTASVNGQLSDLDIAKRMATDPRYSPPRASVPRTVASSAAAPPPATGKRPARVKVELGKPVDRWAPQTAAESLVSPHLSARWSLDALYRAFPRLDRAVVDDCFAGHGANWQRTREQLQLLFPGEMVGGHVAPLPTVLKVQDRSRRPGEPPRPAVEDDGRDEGADGEGLISDAVLERELGAVLDNNSIPSSSSLASASTSSASTAAFHANRRAAYFRAATEAFMAGKGGLAREYARRGHEEGSMMVASAAHSALTVFREANRDVDCHRKVDLHGQRVREAVCILAFVIRRLQRRGAGELTLITGRGTNSAGGKSRLKPAVLSFCQRHGYKASQSNDAEVHVTWR